MGDFYEEKKGHLLAWGIFSTIWTLQVSAILLSTSLPFHSFFSHCFMYSCSETSIGKTLPTTIIIHFTYISQICCIIVYNHLACKDNNFVFTYFYFLCDHRMYTHQIHTQHIHTFDCALFILISSPLAIFTVTFAKFN